MWDVAASSRVDYFIGISKAVVKRIEKFYRREAALIYPPVDVSRFQPSAKLEDYFLLVSRLIPYKRVDIVVHAFNALGLPLVVIGDGRDRPVLEALADGNIKFLGRVSDDELRDRVACCRAFIFPGEEDFGIAPLEAQAAGRPVIALAAGGALETVLDGKTGKFFYSQTPEALAEAVRGFDQTNFDIKAIVEHAKAFGTDLFKEQLQRYIEEKAEEHRRNFLLTQSGL